MWNKFNDCTKQFVSELDLENQRLLELTNIPKANDTEIIGCKQIIKGIMLKAFPAIWGSGRNLSAKDGESIAVIMTLSSCNCRENTCYELNNPTLISNRNAFSRLFCCLHLTKADYKVESITVGLSSCFTVTIRYAWEALIRWNIISDLKRKCLK